MRNNTWFAAALLFSAQAIGSESKLPVLGRIVEDTTVTETPVVNNGRRYIKIVHESRTFLFELLKPDANDPSSYSCVDGGSFVGQTLITGAIKTSQRSNIFMATLKEKCRDKKIEVSPNVVEDLTVGIGWGGKGGEKSKLYTQPFSGAGPNLGFSTKFD